MLRLEAGEVLYHSDVVVLLWRWEVRIEVVWM